MSTYYYEIQELPAQPNPSVAANITFHLHARKHLGKAVVVVQNPIGLMSVVRKQWLRLTRAAQNQRASTLNADRILRLTYAITHMQRVTFAAKTPLEMPSAHIFFITPDQLAVMPHNCFSAYIAADVDARAMAGVINQMPNSSLVIDYTGALDMETLGLHPKKELSDQMAQEWQKAEAFLEDHNISMHDLVHGGVQYMDAVDKALDVLLNESHGFLQIASNFQHASMLAQPVKIANILQQQYEMLGLLAHRVQALSPGTFTLPVDDAFHEEEGTFFLHDYIPDDIYDELVEPETNQRTAQLISQTQRAPIKLELS
jgi:hypothetical protein